MKGHVHVLDWHSLLSSITLHYYYLLAMNTVTTFGENLPICPNFTSLWQLFEGLFSIWQNIVPSYFLCLCFHFCKWPNSDQIMQSTGHTGYELNLVNIEILSYPLFTSSIHYWVFCQKKCHRTGFELCTSVLSVIAYNLLTFTQSFHIYHFQMEHQTLAPFDSYFHFSTFPVSVNRTQGSYDYKSLGSGHLDQPHYSAIIHWIS